MEKLTPRETGKHMSYCLRHNVRIYPVCHGYNSFKIAIEKNGREKIGKEVYPETTTKKGIGVYDKMWELYETLAKRIEAKKTKYPVN